MIKRERQQVRELYGPSIVPRLSVKPGLWMAAIREGEARDSECGALLERALAVKGRGRQCYVCLKR